MLAIRPVLFCFILNKGRYFRQTKAEFTAWTAMLQAYSCTCKSENRSIIDCDLSQQTDKHNKPMLTVPLFQQQMRTFSNSTGQRKWNMHSNHDRLIIWTMTLMVSDTTLMTNSCVCVHTSYAGIYIDHVDLTQDLYFNYQKGWDFE